MRITGETAFDAPQSKMWETLLDSGIMSKCIPGCQKFEAVGDDQFKTELKVGIGAVSGIYDGTLQIKDKMPESAYKMQFEGKGKQGFVKGLAEISLDSQNGQTIVSYASDVEIGGLMASVGQRMLEGVSKFLLNQMFKKLRDYVTEGEVK